MSTAAFPSELLTALSSLTLEQIEKRLAVLDGERAALSRLRRSLIARDRASRRAARRATPPAEEVARG